MKQNIYTLTLFFALCSTAFGQVTITYENFPREVAFIDSVYSSILPQAYPLPTEGADQLWDYSNIAGTNLFEFEYLDASSETDFPNAFNKRNLTLFFQGFEIAGTLFDSLDEDGWYEMGRRTEAVAHSITTLTGGANDTLFFPFNIDLFGERADFLEFPATYQSSWTGTYVETTPFELTVAGFGLQNTPGEQLRTITDSREIVGYGKLIIPDDNDDPSNEMDVLLIKSEVSIVDSFFLMGNPAPPALLGAFNVSQGQTSSSSAYLFYMPNYGKPVMRVAVNANGTEPSNIAFRKDATRTTSTPTSLNEVSLNNKLGVYPNPVSTGQSVTVNFNTLVDNAEITLTDITGRTVHKNTINTPSEHTRLNIPELSSGVYILNVSAQNGTLVKSSKILVN